MLFGWALPAQAVVPTAVEAMIREAAGSHDRATYEAVLKVAKATNPDDAEAIEALGAGLFAEAQARTKREEAARYAQRNMFEGWKGEGQAGFGLTSGNTKETSAVLGVSLLKEGPRTRHKLIGLVDYLRSNGTTTRQKYSGTASISSRRWAGSGTSSRATHAVSPNRWALAIARLIATT
jgi:putative salt-induced outer membrane protein